MGTQVIETLLYGAVTGAIYALMGIGISLVYGTMRVLNFAHGELYMLGGYAAVFGFALGLGPIPVAIMAVLLVGAFAFVLERGVIVPARKSADPTFGPIAATLGLSVLLQNAALMLWGETYRSLPYLMPGVLRLGGIRLAYQRVVILAVACLAIAALTFFLKKTWTGKAIRASAQDIDAARVLGIPAGRIYSGVFVLSSALAALAAVLLGPLFAVSPWMGTSLTTKGFIVAVVGGLGSFSGAILAGFLIGIVEAGTVSVLSTEWSALSAFVVLILVLQVRPRGLLGTARARES